MPETAPTAVSVDKTEEPTSSVESDGRRSVQDTVTTTDLLPHAELAAASTVLVRRWLSEASAVPANASAERLAGVLKDPSGLDFTVGFVDGVIRPEDLTVAARNLAALAPQVPAFLPLPLRAAVRLGGLMAPLLPMVVVPIARRVLRGMVGHLIVDATPKRLGRSISTLRSSGAKLNVNLLGEAVLGDREAARRLTGTRDLLARPDVDYVSIKVSATVAPHSPWAFDADVDHVVDTLTPLFELAASATPAKFINLDMEEYKDLDLTVAVFTRILDQPQFANLSAGIVLQAYLPDALGAMVKLQDWSAARRATGGASIKVRLVKGANLPMEQAESSVRGWPLATWSTKQATDTNYKRILDYALRPDRIDGIHVGVAGHNLFDVAFAWLLAGERGVRSGVEFEMLLGMATGQAEAVKRDVGGLLLYTPVVLPQEFDVAIAYLIRRLEEGASQDNFMSAVFELSQNEALFAREEQRFLASLADLDSDVPLPRRTQDRRISPSSAPTTGFSNTADTDPSLPANREWSMSLLARIPGSVLGVSTIDSVRLRHESDLESVMSTAGAAGTAWSRRSGDERAAILHRVGDSLSRHRADLIEVMASETGKTIDQGDVEVSEAIDFAHYYAELARGLDSVDGAAFVPATVTVVTPPWNFPVAIPAGSTLAALATGSAVVLKPAAQAERCGAVLAEAIWEAGVGRDTLSLIQLEEEKLGRQLISHPAVDRLILTGAYETAELFRSFRRDLPMLAETSGKNAIIVTPSADLDLAVKDVVTSAFGHAGQKCSAASLVILVGTVANSDRFRNQLNDAVASLKVGYPTDATTVMGPIIEPAAGKLLSGLTTLGSGEQWMLKPKQLDETGRLWSPGVRTGVRRGSQFHTTEYFGPVLGIMTASTLEQAIEMQNETDFGLTAGIHSLDSAEISTWLAGVEAGNLYVNRGITGAVVRRQPFGGWKKSAVGAGTKAGGPNYLIGLGSWTPRALTATGHPVRHAAVAALLAIDPTLQAEFEDDSRQCDETFGQAVDVSALSAERNVFRYLPTAVTIRLSEGSSLRDLLRVVGAGLLAGAPLTISSAATVPAALTTASSGTVVVETDAAWLTRAASLNGGRIRLIGSDASALSEAVGGRPDIAIYANEVTPSGRIEMLPFLREQAVSITAHRFGTPNHLTDDLI